MFGPAGSIVAHSAHRNNWQFADPVLAQQLTAYLTCARIATEDATNFRSPIDKQLIAW